MTSQFFVYFSVLDTSVAAQHSAVYYLVNMFINCKFLHLNLQSDLHASAFISGLFLAARFSFGCVIIVCKFISFRARAVNKFLRLRGDPIHYCVSPIFDVFLSFFITKIYLILKSIVMVIISFQYCLIFFSSIIIVNQEFL